MLIFFLWSQQQFDLSEKLFNKALEQDPYNENIYLAYSQFLLGARNDIIKVEQLLQEAITKFPISDELYSNYAIFLYGTTQNLERAKEMFEKGFSLNKYQSVENLSMYAKFLWQVIKDLDASEDMFRHALSLYPNDENLLVAFTIFQVDVRKNRKEAEKLFERARSLNPKKYTFMV